MATVPKQERIACYLVECADRATARRLVERICGTQARMDQDAARLLAQVGRVRLRLGNGKVGSPKREYVVSVKAGQSRAVVVRMADGTPADKGARDWLEGTE